MVLVAVTDLIRLPGKHVSPLSGETYTCAVYLAGALACVLPPVGGVELILPPGALKGVQGQ